MFLTRLSSILLFITNITNKIDWGGALVFERNPPHLKYCGNFNLALCFSHGISLSNQKYPLIQCYRISSRQTRLSIQNYFYGQTSICKSISRMIVKLNKSKKHNNITRYIDYMIYIQSRNYCKVDKRKYSGSVF